MNKFLLLAASAAVLSACVSEPTHNGPDVGRHAYKDIPGRDYPINSYPNYNPERTDADYRGRDMVYDNRASTPDWDAKSREWFDTIDTNNNGSISRGEQAAFSNTMFKDSDTNHDGRVTYDETMAYKARKGLE